MQKLFDGAIDLVERPTAKRLISQCVISNSTEGEPPLCTQSNVLKQAIHGTLFKSTQL